MNLCKLYSEHNSIDKTADYFLHSDTRISLASYMIQVSKHATSLKVTLNNISKRKEEQMLV